MQCKFSGININKNDLFFISMGVFYIWVTVFFYIWDYEKLYIVLDPKSYFALDCIHWDYTYINKTEYKTIGTLHNTKKIF